MSTFRSFSICLLLATYLACTAAFLEIPCPMGCADATCLIGSGCSNCRAGWCRHYGGKNVGVYCVTACPDGYYCHAIGFCTQQH